VGRLWVFVAIGLVACGGKQGGGNGASDAGVTGRSSSGDGGLGGTGATPATGGGSGTAGGGTAAGAASGGSGAEGGVAGAGGAADGGSGAGRGGVSGSAGIDSGGAGTGGAAGGSSAGSAGSTAGASSLDCTGTFGEPRLVFDPFVAFQSPTLNPDETELLYVGYDPGSDYVQFLRATRPSKADLFGLPEPATGLENLCLGSPQGTIDLSPDGRRAYVVCYDPAFAISDALWVAERSAPNAPFVVSSAIYGLVGASAAIATGELTLYSAGPALALDPGLLFERPTTDVPFGGGIAIPGLEDTAIVTPDPSPDGLSLFVGMAGQVLVATRTALGEPFTTLDPVLTPADSMTIWSSATISEDCRSLYAIHVVSDNGGSRRTLEVVTR